MNELVAHLFGDYVFQNSWMAEEKTRRWLPAVAHAAIYTACFLPVTRRPAALAVIGGTHLLIDHYRLINHWIRAKEGVSDSFWLMVIQDNALHLLINRLALEKLG